MITMDGPVWWALFTLLPLLGTMVGAAAYRLRERARWTAITAVLRQAPGGAQVRYKACDTQGRAATEWEIILPPAAESGDEYGG